ncbi:MAG TPA: hypothetical protein VGI54_00965 [Solirubrobacteraceae bacterium]
MSAEPASRGGLDALRPSRLSPRVRRVLGIALAVGVAVGLVLLLAGKQHQFTAAVDLAPAWLLVLTALLQVVASVSRSEAWVGCIRAAGGRAPRRCLYRASSASFAGGLLTGSLAAAARIAALRRTAPQMSPRIPALIAAELPIVAVELALGAAFSFTLVGPLGLPWWAPILTLAAIGALVYGLRRVAGLKREGFRGLAVLRHRAAAGRVFVFAGIAILAQIARNYLILHALGVHATVFDAIAVLIVLAALGALPVGPSVGAASTLVVLGPHGVATVAAVGVLLTATATAGSLAFALWGAGDAILVSRRDGDEEAGFAPALGHMPAPLA